MEKKTEFFHPDILYIKSYPFLSCFLNYFVLTCQWEIFPWPLIIQSLESRKTAVSICSTQSDQYLVKFMHNNEYVSPRTCFVKFWYIILPRIDQDLDRRVSAFSFYFTRDVGMLTIYFLLFSPYYCFVTGSILPQWNRHVFQKILPLGPNVG